MKPVLNYSALRNYSLLLIIFVLAASGCKTGGDVEVNFRMNGRDITASDEEPTNADDPNAMLVVQVGDTIKLWDVSQPRENVVTQTWDLNSDGKIDYEDTDYPPNITFPTPGRNKITLCINNEENCVAKWVNVTGKLPKAAAQTPSFTVLAPNITNRKVITREVPLKMEVRNVYNREDISIKVNDKAVNSFTLADGIITGSIPVLPGANLIEVSALTNSGEATELIRIQRGQERMVATTPRPPKPPSVKPPTVDMRGILAETTEASAYDIRFRARNVTRDQVTASVNGTPLSSSKITLTGNSGVIKQVPLRMGMNDIVVIATNDGGTKTDNYKVERVAPTSSGPIVNSAIPSNDPPAYTPPAPVRQPEPEPQPRPADPDPAPSPVEPDPTPQPRAVDPEPDPVATKPAPEPQPVRTVTIQPTKPAPPPPTAPAPAPVVNRSSGIAYFGVPVSNVNMATCTNFNVTNTSMKIAPKQPLVLMGGDVYSSGCGTLTVTLSTGKASVSEYFELSEGQSSLTFNKLNEKELNSTIPYKITMKTGPSPNCEGNVPTLLDARSCGKSSDGDNRIGLSYGSNVSLFSIKYKY